MQKSKITTTQWISEVEIIHNFKYGYSKVKYTNNKAKVTIICPDHGEFEQVAKSHKNGFGCKKCAGFEKTTKEFIAEASLLHDNKFIYDEVVYVDSTTPIKIKCKNNHAFHMSPNDHLRGNGCPDCKGKILSAHFVWSLEKFITEAIKVHGDKFSYIKSKYENYNVPLIIICNNCYREFPQSPNGHLRGYGCKYCRHIISKPETEFLDYMKVPLRNVKIPEWKTKPVDGLDGNIIYEFLGDYWHGNPIKYPRDKINKKVKRTYGELYDKTFVNLNRMKSYGYIVKYIWEYDWKQFKKGIDKELKIITI